MIVVTISKWRQKVVWLLAAILVAAVLLGQLAGGSGSKITTQPRDHYISPAAGQDAEQAVTLPAAGDSSWLESLLEKLRSFYRGE